MIRALLFLALAFLLGCEETDTAGKITLIFNNKVDFAPLVLNSSFVYENPAGEDFKVQELRYYVSHISFIKADGKGFYQVPVARDGSHGLYLIDQSSSNSQTVPIENIPAGDYEGLSFQIGFSAEEVDLPQASGPLSDTSGMFRSERDGFNFWRLKGTSNASPLAEKNIFYKFFDATGQQSVKATVYFRTSPLETTKKALVRNDISPVVEINVDAYELFSTPHLIIFAKEPSLEGSPSDIRLMQNLADAFSFDHLHNAP